MDGTQDLAGFLVQRVGAPVRVEPPQLFDQPVVLSQEERVQCDHPQVLVGSGIPCPRNATMVTFHAASFLSNTILSKVQDGVAILISC